MIKLDALRPIFIGLAMSFKILGSTASCPIFIKLVALPINMGSINPILYQTWGVCEEKKSCPSHNAIKPFCFLEISKEIYLPIT